MENDRPRVIAGAFILREIKPRSSDRGIRQKSPVKDGIRGLKSAEDVILNNKKELLLISSFKWPGRFFLPGGHVESGERIEQALKREIFEEVGLRVKIIDFLCFQEAIFSPLFYKKRHFIFFDYLCEVVGESSVVPDEREVEKFIWLPPEKALKIKTDPFTKKAIKIYLAKA